MNIRKEVKTVRIPFFKQVSWYLVFALFLISIVPKAEAGISPSEMVSTVIDRAHDMERVQKAIESKMIRERLGKLGFTEDEIASRLGRLTDQQVHQLALNLDSLKVAGDDGLGVIVLLLVIAILVVILLQVTGHKVIVK